MKKNLLISGLGGSLFPYLHHKLSGTYNLFYLDNDVSLKYLYPDLNFFAAPLVTDPQYFELVRSLIVDKNIHFYIPLIDEEIVFAKKYIDAFNGVAVMTPSLEFAELSLNKFKLMDCLQKHAISNIRSFTGDKFNWEISPPVFVKPISGRGSRGIKSISSQRALEAYYMLEGYDPANILIQEEIQGTEYTVGVTINNLNDVLEISSKRIVKKRGITIVAVTEINPIITGCVEKIVQELRPAGPINIQLFLNPSGEVKIFEINPRFSTTTIMSYAAGIDVISLYVNHFGKRFPEAIIQPKPGIVLHRRWESCFYEK